MNERTEMLADLERKEFNECKFHDAACGFFGKTLHPERKYCNACKRRVK